LPATWVDTREIPLAELTRFPGNARRGNVAEIRKSLMRHGQYRAVVVRDDNGAYTVLAGNHTTAALETLAIVAYKQPITKGEIESIRGVNSDYSIQKLLEKELIVIIGRSEDLPGKPLIYSTSKSFMDYFGINQTADLPRLREVLGESLEEPSLINYTPAAIEINTALVVSEEGELLENNPSDASEPTEDGA